MSPQDKKVLIVCGIVLVVGVVILAVAVSGGDFRYAPGGWVPNA